MGGLQIPVPRWRLTAQHRRSACPSLGLTAATGASSGVEGDLEGRRAQRSAQEDGADVRCDPDSAMEEGYLHVLLSIQFWKFPWFSPPVAP